MMIIARPSANYSTIANYCVATSHVFFEAELLPIIWETALMFGIDPVGAVAQSAKETNWGMFGGAITAAWRNTAGIKTREEIRQTFPDVAGGDKPFAHQIFPNWYIGAVAQMQHLRAYCQVPFETFVGYNATVDPRNGLVNQSGPPCIHWRDLGGRWAPNMAYGAQIESMMVTMTGTSL